MILKAIKAKNFKRFHSLEVEGLPAQGIIGVLGLNESGKSTLGEVISYCLFGRTPSAGKGQIKSLVRWGAPFFETSLSFEINETPYTIYRRFRLDGPSESYLLNDLEEKELAVGDRDVTHKVSQLLGLGFEEFRHSIFVAQKELSLITDSRVRRKDVLEGLLGLNKIRDVDRQVARQLQTLENEKNLEAIRMEEVQRLDEEVARVRAQVDECLEVREALMSERRQYRSALDEAQEELKRLETAREVLRDVEALQSLLTEHREALKTLETELAAADTAQANYDHLGKELESLRGEIQNFQEDQKDLERKLRLYETYEDLKTRLEGRRDELKEAEGVLTELRERKNEMDAAEAAAEVRMKDLDSLLRVMEAFPTLDSFEHAVGRLALRYESMEKKYEGFRGKVHREVERLDAQLSTLNERLQTAQAVVRAPTVEPVDSSQLEALEQLAEEDPSAAMGWIGPTLVIVGISSALGAFLSPFALAGLALVAVPYQREKTRLRKLSEARKELKSKKEQAARYDHESRLYLEAEKTKENLLQEIAKLEEGMNYHRRLLAFWDDLPIETLGQVQDTYEAMAEFRDSLTDELLALIKAFLDESKGLSRYISPDLPLEEFFEGNFRERYSSVLGEREEIQVEIANFKRQAVGKGPLMRQLEAAVVRVAELKQVVKGLEQEAPAFRLPPEPLSELMTQHGKNAELLSACQNRLREAGNERESARALLGGRGPLELKRDSLMKEIALKTEALYAKKNLLPEDDLSEEALARQAALIEQNREREAGTLLEEARLMGNKDTLDEALRRLSNRQQDERRIAQRMKLLERRREELVSLRECLAITLDRVRRRILPQIRAYFSHILGRLTNGRYNEVELDEDFNMAVFSPEKGALVDISNLSGGTADQMFIALRLALARSTGIGDGGPGRPFLFLDEPLSAFDADRRALFFQLLRGMESNFQQIFLISHLPDISAHLDHHLTLMWEGATLGITKSWENQKNLETTPAN